MKVTTMKVTTYGKPGYLFAFDFNHLHFAKPLM